MRHRSIAGPLILILIGGLFLLYNLRPELPIADLISLYWPFLLIAWGLIRLVEVVVSFSRATPMRRVFSGGEIWLVVLICLFGSAMFAAHRHGFRFGVRGMEMFGEAYDYPVNARKDVGAVRRVVFENLRGNVRVSGADAPEIRITGHKSIRALRRADADAADRNSAVDIVAEGDTVVVRTNQERVSENQRISTDLDAAVPRGVSVELRGRFGDYDLSDLAGNVEISSDRADVRLVRIGGDARVDLRRSDIVRMAEVKGNVDLQGRGNEVELENIAGQVTISGSYGGTMAFKNLAKPLHFESSNTDLRVEALPGQISMDLAEFAARNVVGPMRLVTKTRDVKIENFTNALDLETERGDIELLPTRLPLAKIEARSRSGKIELTLPAQAAFQLQASTDHGEAVNDFGPPIQKQTEGRSASLKGTVGAGPVIHLSTQRGSIAVRKAGVGTAEAQL